MAEESQARAFGARFEDVARRLPLKAALVDEGRAIDYATLESTSRAIAARSEAAAAGRPGFAALLFSRKTPTVQAMVASLRCGRAYVPLDGGDPDERLDFVLRDGAPAILLTDRTLAARARSLAGATCAVVEIDGDERPDPAFALPEVAPGASVQVSVTRNGFAEFTTVRLKARDWPVAVNLSGASWSRRKRAVLSNATPRFISPMPWLCEGSVSFAETPVR